jgi:hypothetical protein
MKTRIFGLVALAIGLAFPLFAQQQTNTAASESTENKKQINFSGTHYWSGTPKAFQIDPGRIIAQQDILGVRVNDSGDGPFHGASVYIAVLQYRIENSLDPVVRSRAYEAWTDKDGDKVIWELTDAPSGAPSGTARLIDGTGKYRGWQGTMEYTLLFPKSFPEGTMRGICREVVKIVAPAEMK